MKPSLNSFPSRAIFAHLKNDPLRLRYFACLGLLALAGCAGPPSPAAKLEHTEMFVDPRFKSRIQFMHDNQDGVTFVGWPTDSLLKVCLTPDPDALAGVGRSVALGATGPASAAAAAAAGTTTGTPAPGGPSASASGSASFNVANLGGRTQMVLLERDLLYRACEMSNNLQLTKAETLKVYASIIDKVIDLARLLGPNPGSAAATPTNFSSNANPSADLASNSAANLSSPPGGATPGASPSATSNAAGQPPPPPPPSQ